ncbi:hypothetical protein CCM_08420 [Cordyceps militaris CM01]|uniref:Uncharacterized protein n=1 Tax=Cordyceps militaris (strain CM01) TaxID=983644 RepID=G3JR81_CORMM|nr:uncharacterized protein CCM_08420 [Cordyceps militaris CM01]EGX88377.1 hypothetical protein CCM_08420 [Cordyceps militaris CM01]
MKTSSGMERQLPAHITSATTAQANVATEETPPSEIPLRTVHINSIDTVRIALSASFISASIYSISLMRLAFF